MRIEAKYHEFDSADRILVNCISSSVEVLIDGVKFSHEFPVMTSAYGLNEEQRSELEARREWSRKLVNKLNGTVV